MSRMKWLVLLASLAGILYAAVPSAKRQANPPACMITAAAATQGTPCSECSNTCKAKTDQCKDGSVKACYEAAACLCQCNLDAGGCGSSSDALKKCVDENKKAAKAMEGERP